MKKTTARVFRYFTPLGYSVIQYDNPLKAMDNFREIRPEAVIFNEMDYPRHWKLAVQFLRQNFSKETAPFLLVVNRDFPETELDKAHLLGVNGILKVEEEADLSLKDLESQILRYKPSPDVRKERHLLPLGSRVMDIMFMNPENLQLVTSRVLELSENGAIVKPTERIKTEGLKEGVELKGCSLKTGESIVSLTVRIVKINGIFELEFLEGKDDWKDQVLAAIQSFN